MARISTPYEAEQRMAAWLMACGYSNVQWTGPGTDGGVDVISDMLVGQVKAERRPIGRPELQQLVGAAAVAGRKPVFFSLGGYTREAMEWADQARLPLFRFSLDALVTPANPYAQYMLHPADQRDGSDSSQPLPAWTVARGLSEAVGHDRATLELAAATAAGRLFDLRDFNAQRRWSVIEALLSGQVDEQPYNREGFARWCATIIEHSWRSAFGSNNDALHDRLEAAELSWLTWWHGSVPFDLDSDDEDDDAFELSLQIGVLAMPIPTESGAFRLVTEVTMSDDRWMSEKPRDLAPQLVEEDIVSGLIPREHVRVIPEPPKGIQKVEVDFVAGSLREARCWASWVAGWIEVLLSRVERGHGYRLRTVVLPIPK